MKLWYGAALASLACMPTIQYDRALMPTRTGEYISSISPKLTSDSLPHLLVQQIGEGGKGSTRIDILRVDLNNDRIADGIVFWRSCSNVRDKYPYHFYSPKTFTGLDINVVNGKIVSRSVPRNGVPSPSVDLCPPGQALSEE